MKRFGEIYDEYEFSDVVTGVVQPSGGSTFIGISDIAIEGIYQWINGDTSTTEKLGFSPNKPNDSGGNEDWNYSLVTL